MLHTGKLGKYTSQSGKNFAFEIVSTTMHSSAATARTHCPAAEHYSVLPSCALHGRHSCQSLGHEPHDILCVVGNLWKTKNLVQSAIAPATYLDIQHEPHMLRAWFCQVSEYLLEARYWFARISDSSKIFHFVPCAFDELFVDTITPL